MTSGVCIIPFSEVKVLGLMSEFVSISPCFRHDDGSTFTIHDVFLLFNSLTLLKKSHECLCL